MGRTIPTTHQQLVDDIAALKGFRRGLRIEYHPALDRLIQFARQETAAISSANHLLPFESALLAMVVGLSRQVEILEATLHTLQVEDETAKRLVVRRIPQP